MRQGGGQRDGDEERTTDTLLEISAGGGIILRGESGRDLAEIIRDSDGRVDIGKSKVRIDISRKCEFGTDLEDPSTLLST